MLSRNWIFEEKPIMSVKSGAIEDFTVRPENGKFRAYFTSGPNLQDQRLSTATSDSPLGPFENIEMSFPSRQHTRLYRSRIDEKRRIITQVWPGLPKVGLWLHTDIDELTTYRELLIPPVEPYDIAAANPGTFNNPDGDVDIAWEGRSKKVEWKIYVGALHGDGSVTVDKREICDARASSSSSK